MVIDSVFAPESSSNRVRSTPPNFLVRWMSAVSRQSARFWCGMHGHLILLHFEPNKLSLQCGLCGYTSEGWEVGQPKVARRQLESRTHSHHVRTERRHMLRAVPSNARM